MLIVTTILIAGPSTADDAAKNRQRQVLAFYYGWYGTPPPSGRWLHWNGVDLINKRIANTADFPVSGPYDSHDVTVVENQVRLARSAGITGFIASWWGQNSFEDQGLPQLLATAAQHHFAVTAYYEKVDGTTPTDRIQAAVSDLNYLLSHYGKERNWLRLEGKPVIFVYGRAIAALSVTEWQQVIQHVHGDNPDGAILIADSYIPEVVEIFDGASTYNITNQIRLMSPDQVRAWAHEAYPRMIEASGPNKISTLTVIPGYDDRALGRLPPRPTTYRWGGAIYEALWEEAIAASPNYILITSWNEWHEGSELEPSLEYGLHGIEETKNFAARFLNNHK